jgi:retron-type reverse transcriptase
MCNITNGMKQGGVISPILFNIYIDELLIKLRAADFGC